MWRPDTLVLRGLLLSGTVLSLVASAAGADPIPYTLSGPVPFDDLGISGAINPVSGAEFESFDFTGAGEVPGASEGQHVCNNSLTANAGFFNACFNAMNDMLIYSVTLDSDSDPMVGIAPFLTGTVTAGEVWAGYIFGDGSTHDPDGEIFIATGRGVVFQNFGDSSDSSFYLQPGETSSVLITAYLTPPGLGPDLAGDVELNFRIFSGLPGFDVGPVGVTQVPEPGTGALLVLGLSVLGLRRNSL